MRNWKSIVLGILILGMAAGGLGPTASSGVAAAAGSGGAGGPAIEIGVFRERLAPYGRWFTVAGYGYVWSPFSVAAGWGPYVDGSWAYTDAGWTWISDDPWGWATCHYGRWFFDPIYGWVWVPGSEWGPAWVDWMYGDGFIGWAPLSPAFVGISGFVPIPVTFFRFCRDRDFDRPHINRFIVPTGRSRDLFDHSHRVTRFDRINGVVVNRSLSRETIERAAGHKVQSEAIGGPNSPQELGRKANRDLNRDVTSSSASDSQALKQQRRLERQQAAEQDRSLRQQERQQQVDRQESRQQRTPQRATQSQQEELMRAEMRQQRQAERQQMQMQQQMQQQAERQQMRQQRQAERQQMQMPAPRPPVTAQPNAGGGNGGSRRR